MNIIYIYDKQFNPSFSPSPFLKPNKFKFKFLSKIDDIINLSNINICLYTEQCFNIATKHVQMGCTFRKIGWIREPPKIHIYPYNFFVNKGNNIFDKVIINNTEWLNKIPNSIYIPNMMTFLRYKDITLPSSSKKNKLVSIVCSNKSKTKGHRLRKNIINYLIENNCDVDLYGNMVNNFVDNKIDTLHNYMFQIVIENCIIDGYFSEKIIDCFFQSLQPVVIYGPSQLLFCKRNIGFSLCWIICR